MKKLALADALEKAGVDILIDSIYTTEESGLKMRVVVTQAILQLTKIFSNSISMEYV